MASPFHHLKFDLSSLQKLLSPQPEPRPKRSRRSSRKNKGMDMDSIAVGKQVRLLGYRSEQLFRDGEPRRVIRKNP